MRCKRSFLLLLCLVGMGLMILPSRLPTQGIASCPPYEFICDFYDQCLDKLRPCGEDGYAAWASTWCKEMHTQAVLHMPSAARFVPEFFKCLTQDITKRVEEHAASACTDLRSIGILGYRSCMNDREARGEGLNFCDLTLEDWQRILGTIELGDGIIHPKDMTAAIIKECSHCIAAQLLHGTGGNKDSLTRLSWLRTVLDGLPRAIRDEVLAAKIKLPT